MKVGILTFPKSPSLGCSLQMFALYTKLKELGADAEIIMYTPDGLVHNRTGKQTAGQRIKNRLIDLFIKSAKPSFEEFEARLDAYPAEAVKTGDALRRLAQRYDRIIVGSDQVWNPAITGSDLNYYLIFSDRYERNAAYAPSFGIDAVEEDREEIGRLLKNIKYLSAREEQGQKIIRELTSRQAPRVLDPTMLLDPGAWKAQEKQTQNFKKPYVLYYTVKSSPRLRAYAERFAKANGCILVTVGGRFAERFLPQKHPAFGVGPGEFLGLVSSARFVITNSFHGTVFSVLYHKEFLVEYASDTNSRLTNLIGMLGLENCVANADDEVYQAPAIDYQAVDRILTQNRAQSTGYLKSIIEE